MIWRLRARLLYYFAIHTGKRVVELPPSSLSLLLEVPVDELSDACDRIAPTLLRGRIGLRLSRAGNYFLEVGKTDGEAERIREIFGYWIVKAEKHGRTKLSPLRTERIRCRLRDGFSVLQIKRAIDSCVSDPFYHSPEKGAKRYNDIELICRSIDKIERFLELADAKTAKERMSVRDRIRGHR